MKPCDGRPSLGCAAARDKGPRAQTGPDARAPEGGSWRSGRRVEVGTTHPRQPRVSERDRLAEYCHLNADAAFSRGAFATLYARPLPANLPERRGAYTLNTPLCDIQGSLPARLLRIVMRRQASSAISDDPDSLMARQAREMLEEMPLLPLQSGTSAGIDGSRCARLHALESHLMAFSADRHRETSDGEPGRLSLPGRSGRGRLAPPFLDVRVAV